MAQTKTKSSTSSKTRANTASAKQAKEKELLEKRVREHRIKDEIWAILIIALGVFFVIAMQTSAAGKLGEITKSFFWGIFGPVANVIPYYLIVYGILLILNKVTHLTRRSLILLTLTFLMVSTIYSNHFINVDEYQKLGFKYVDMLAWYKSGIKGASGGALGMLLSLLFLVWFGQTGLYIFATTILIVCILMLANTPISQFLFNYKAKKAIRKQIRMEEEEAEQQLQEIRKKELEELGIVNPASIIKSEDGNLTDYVSEAKERQNKRNIISYMLEDKAQLGKDSKPEIQGSDSMVDFESEQSLDNAKEMQFGLEESPKVKAGFGMDGAHTDENIEDKEITEKKTLNANEKKELWKNVPRFFHITKEPEFELDKFNTASRLKEDQILAHMDLTNSGSEKEIDNSELYFTEDEVQEMEEKFDVENIVTKIDVPAKNPQQSQAVALSKEEKSLREDLEKDDEKETEYIFPPLDLLIEKKPEEKAENKEMTLLAKAEKLERTLQDFKVDAKVTNVMQGPAVTRYEVQPNTGVKVNSIVKLADDIALNMEAKSIRIEAPIPGKPAVGIEIENESIKMIRIREILASKEFWEAKSKISFAVGKDIEGNAVVADLKSMPHMLIAGSTGSGKSVCINSIIISLLYKAKPSEVKLVLIDPKVVELGIYNGIPHMLIPVVTEPGKAAAALSWAVSEMNSRYKKFAESGVRDLESYNNLVSEEGDVCEKLPQIVIVIDELADLMMAAPSQVEDSICRLAQMARAAGMHLIVATQRPSVDVVTGLIKANIPSRIAFAVSSQFDSRTILDMAGAEKLVGKGDMLFAPMGLGKPIRVQGNFITDKEVNAVINFLKEQFEEGSECESSLALLESLEDSLSSEDASNFEDELMSEAIESVLKAQQASASMLQRRFRIGYNRAARLIDEMEALGIIGEADGSRARTVNYSYEEYFRASETNDNLEID